MNDSFVVSDVPTQQGLALGGSELKLTKREFNQKLREIKLNNLLK